MIVECKLNLDKAAYENNLGLGVDLPSLKKNG